jgi:hypothetical protein
LGLVPAGNVVIAEAGHNVGQAPAAVYPVVSEYVALGLGTGRMAQARLAIGTTAFGGGYQVFAVAAGPLRGHAILVLLRRVDQPGYPVLAVGVG